MHSVKPPNVEVGNAGARRIMYAAYQPVVDMGDGALFGYEALARFSDDSSPLVEFKIAEAEGRLTEFELDALAMAIDGASALPPGAMLGVNLSPLTMLATSEWIGIIGSAARPVVVELTEHHPVQDYQALRSVLDDLPPSAALAIDDFGTGYCGRRHVLELRPDIVKFPRCTVLELCRAGRGASNFFEATIDWLTASGITLIAEGIETEAQRGILLDAGIVYGQGYLFGKPERAASSGGRGVRFLS